MFKNRLFSSVWLLWAFFARSIAQKNCDSGSISFSRISIENVTVQNPNLRRGLAVGIGTPPQPLAFAIAAHVNNTVVYHDTAECPAPVVLGDCPRALIGDGGLFFEQKSTTWAEQTTMENAKAFPENDFTSLNDSDIWGIDMIHLNATTTVEAFPIAISTHRTFPLNSIGLGLNSSLLDALNASGKIMSSTWSVFWGLIGAEAQNQMDGSVILGGFDRAKTTGNNLTLPVQTATDCRTGLVVMVQDISMEFASGKAQSILDSPLEMCIDPSFQLVSLPSGVMDLFSKNAGGSFLRLADGLYNHGMVYKLKDVYDGNLSFLFEKGLRITIPSHQLVLPDYGLDKSGAYTSLDDTRNILVSRPVNDTRFGPPNKFYLGQLFLTAAYLMVNLERSPKTFTLWQNNATDVEDIVMIDSVGEVCSAEFPSKVEPSTPKNLIKSSTNSSGRIVGIVLAVLLVVLIACGVAYWYIRRRRLRQIHQKGDKRTSAIQDHKRLPDIPTSSDMALREITSEASRYHLFRLGSESYELPENHPNAAELQDSYQQNSMTPKELPALLNR